MKKFFFFLVSLLVIIGLLLTGCSHSVSQQGKFLRHNHGQEPESIDPTLNSTLNGGTLILAMFEGLTKLDANDNPVPGIAQTWDISPDKTKYTFHLRKDAKWSDGQTVTAHDFYYSWKRALNPETAADYSYMLFYIKNAEEYNYDDSGNYSFDNVGIKVLDNFTLEVTLEAPTPYWLKITAFPTLVPLRQDIITSYGERWALSPQTYIGNGPFRLAEWTSKDMMKLVKNEEYYDKEQVKLDGIIETFIAEESTMLASYEAGELDVIDTVPLDELARLKKESSEFHMIPQTGTYYYCFNVTEVPFNKTKVRQALALAIDREDLVTKVNKTGIPATAFTPSGVPDVNPDKDFRTIGGDFFPPKAQPEKAKTLLAEAGYPDPKKLLGITLVYNTNENHKKIAEAVLEMWKNNLGIENITLANQEWGVYMSSLQSGDFQIAKCNWLADYNDPMSFIDLFTTGNGNNLAQWSNKEFDNLIQKARIASTEQERMNLLHQAEKLYMQDAILIPLFHDTENTMIKPYVKNLHKSPLGFTYFDKADIIK